MFSDAWVLQTAAGLANGFIYASLALALVMIHRTTHHINFAQGEMATLSTFLAWSLMQAGLPLVLALALTLVLSLIMGVVVHRLCLRPVERAPLLTQVMVFVGLLMVFHAFMSWQWGTCSKALRVLFRSKAWLPCRGGRAINWGWWR